MNRPRKQLSPFAARWLAEIRRLEEAQQGNPEDDGEAVSQARLQSPDPEQRIVWRARFLAEGTAAWQALHDWQQGLRLAVLVAAALALLIGFTSALAVLGDSSRAVNIIWALGALLGLNALMLLVWLAGLFLMRRHGSGGGLLGRLSLWLARRLAGRRRGLPGRALTGLLASRGLEPWLLSGITHFLWLLMLLAAGAGLLLALSLRSYDFVWETTILSSEVFVSFVRISGALPAKLGFQVPDAELVRQSASGLLGEQGRVEAWGRVWASWLLGCLLVYGVLPRLLLSLLSLLRLWLGLHRYRLDTQSPEWLALATRLQPDSERGGVTDPERADPGAAELKRKADASGPPALLSLEMDEVPDWPPTGLKGVELCQDADARDQRQSSIQAVQDWQPSRLLFACDTRLSPDRGSLRFLQQLAAEAAVSRVLLLRVEAAGEQRLLSWRESLTGLGFTEREIMQNRAAALAWLEGGGHG